MRDQVEGKEYAPFIIYINTILTLLNLLSELVKTYILAIEEHLSIACVVGIGHTQPVASLKNEGIHEIGDIAVVGQQHPVAVATHTQERRRLVELDAVGFLIVP